MAPFPVTEQIVCQFVASVPAQGWHIQVLKSLFVSTTLLPHFSVW